MQILTPECTVSIYSTRVEDMLVWGNFRDCMDKTFFFFLSGIITGQGEEA